STEELLVGDGWRQVRIWPEGTRIQWELAVDGPPEMLTARGARLLRHVSDPGLAERADLISPSGQRVSMIWPHRWDDHQSGGMLAVGDAPPEIGVPEILTLLRVDLDSTFVSLRHLAVELDLAVLVPSTHRVLRLDDNGNTFRVGRYATRAAAEAVARHFEDLGHKQSYWTEPA
ncbi:MAG: hypothetical protein KC656_36680, partial [Myxococcales bacterium]|nr:hypothetical protein [Myxococcales bacterium]